MVLERIKMSDAQNATYNATGDVRSKRGEEANIYLRRWQHCVSYPSGCSPGALALVGALKFVSSLQQELRPDWAITIVQQSAREGVCVGVCLLAVGKSKALNKSD